MDKKKWIIAGSIGVVSLAGAYLYLQYRKIMNYVLNMKSIKIAKINKDLLEFNVILNFTNNSDVNIHVTEQVYKIYINNVESAKSVNEYSIDVKPKQTTEIPIKLKVYPAKLSESIGNKFGYYLLNPSQLKLTFDIKVKVKLLFFSISLPFKHTTTLKELM